MLWIAVLGGLLVIYLLLFVPPGGMADRVARVFAPPGAVSLLVSLAHFGLFMLLHELVGLRRGFSSPRTELGLIVAFIIASWWAGPLLVGWG